VYPGQAEETGMLPVLDVLPGRGYPKDNTYQDKYGLLQGMRNMQSGVPGSGDNHGVIIGIATSYITSGLHPSQ